MPVDQPRRPDAVRLLPDPRQQALFELAQACSDFHLATRFVTYRGRPELRIWDASGRGAAVQIGADSVDDEWSFTRQGSPIAACDNLPEAVHAVRSRLRVRDTSHENRPPNVEDSTDLSGRADAAENSRVVRP